MIFFNLGVIQSAVTDPPPPPPTHHHQLTKIPFSHQASQNTIQCYVFLFFFSISSLVSDVLLKFPADLSLFSQQPSTACCGRGVPGPHARLRVASGVQNGAAKCPFRPETGGGHALTSNSVEVAMATTPCAAEGQVRSLRLVTLRLRFINLWGSSRPVRQHICPEGRYSCTLSKFPVVPFPEIRQNSQINASEKKRN